MSGILAAFPVLAFLLLFVLPASSGFSLAPPPLSCCLFVPCSSLLFPFLPFVSLLLFSLFLVVFFRLKSLCYLERGLRSEAFWQRSLPELSPFVASALAT